MKNYSEIKDEPISFGASDTFTLQGRVESILWHQSGSFETLLQRNTVVNVGKAEIMGLTNATTTGPFLWLAIGDGTAAPGTTDTALVSELQRGSATASRTTTIFTNDTAQWVHTFNFTIADTINEAAVFDEAASTTGVMLARATIGPYPVGSGDSLQLTYKLQVT